MRIEQVQPSNPDQQFAEAVGVDSAGAGSWKAPSCDTDGSTISAYPVVGPGAPLERDTYPTAGVGQKLSWGFGGEAPKFSARCAVAPSLDSIKNNRHTHPVPAWERRPSNRESWCGRWSLQGLNPVTGRPCTRRMNCKTWGCCYCAHVEQSGRACRSGTMLRRWGFAIPHPHSRSFKD